MLGVGMPFSLLHEPMMPASKVNAVSSCDALVHRPQPIPDGSRENAAVVLFQGAQRKESRCCCDYLPASKMLFTNSDLLDQEKILGMLIAGLTLGFSLQHYYVLRQKRCRATRDHHVQYKSQLCCKSKGRTGFQHVFDMELPKEMPR